MKLEHLDPPTLVRNPAFSQAIVVSGRHKVVYVGGQNAVDGATRQVVGRGDLAVLPDDDRPGATSRARLPRGCAGPRTPCRRSCARHSPRAA